MSAEVPTNEWNPTIYQGATFAWSVAMKNPDGSAMDLTGYTVRGQLRRSHGAVTVDLDLTAGPMITISDEAGGIISVEIPAATTETLTGSYKYDVEIANGSMVYRILQGTIFISPEVTR